MRVLSLRPPQSNSGNGSKCMNKDRYAQVWQALLYLGIPLKKDTRKCNCNEFLFRSAG